MYSQLKKYELYNIPVATLLTKFTTAAVFNANGCPLACGYRLDYRGSEVLGLKLGIRNQWNLLYEDSN
jgi:hypothetical protein